MTLQFGTDRPRRRPNLTPMIDVVFLLLVFFMLVSRFGIETVLPLSTAGGAGADWSGPPRLVEVGPAGRVTLNGVPVGAGTLDSPAPADLASALQAALAPLMASSADPVVLRGRDGAALSDLVGVTEALRAGGVLHLLLVD